MEKKHLMSLLNAIDALSVLADRFGGGEYDSALIDMIVDLFGFGEYYDFAYGKEAPTKTWFVCKSAIDAIKDIDGDLSLRVDCIFNASKTLKNAQHE